MLLQCLVKRLKELGFKQGQRVSFCRIVVRNDLQVINSAWAVIQARNRRIELTTPADQSCDEGAVVFL